MRHGIWYCRRVSIGACRAPPGLWLVLMGALLGTLSGFGRDGGGTGIRESSYHGLGGRSLLDDSISLRGSLRSVLVPLEDRSLSARASGVIEAYHVEEGRLVAAGGLILELDSALERAALDEAQALLGGTLAELEKAKLNFERAEALRQEEINSQKQMEEARYMLALAGSRHQQAAANLTKSRILLDARFVRSPIDGIFLRKVKSVGESVERLEVVARVTDPSHLMLEVYCDVDLFGRLSAGGSYSIEMLEGPSAGQLIRGAVFHLDPMIDPASGTFRAKVKVTPSTGVAAGMAARLLPFEEELAEVQSKNDEPLN